MCHKKTTKKRGESLFQLSKRFASDEDCLKLLESLRWPDGVSCPDCDSKRIGRIKTRLRWYQCKDCRAQFSATSGTVMHRSHLPLQKWILATALICNAKKGVSAKQIERDLDVQYRTAWYLMHRLRRAMRETAFLKKFSGIVELDETYVGGKPRKQPKAPGGDLFHSIRGKRQCRIEREKREKKSLRGRSLVKKSIVFGIRERDGFIRAEVVPDASGKSLCSLVRKYVDQNCEMLCADQWPSYNQLAKDYNPQRINHTFEYVRGQVHVNSVETFWAILKRGVIGTFHKVSKKYLPSYLQEFTYRFNYTRNGNGVDLWRKVLANALIHDSSNGQSK